jgi:UTP:GlnB (protein PII) uridylyltransferase
MPTTSEPLIAELDGDIRARLIAVLRQHGVRRAGVFGSFARGEQTSASDVDLLIEPDAEATLFTLARPKRLWRISWDARLITSPSMRLRLATARACVSASFTI